VAALPAELMDLVKDASGVMAHGIGGMCAAALRPAGRREEGGTDPSPAGGSEVVQRAMDFISGLLGMAAGDQHNTTALADGGDLQGGRGRGGNNVRAVGRVGPAQAGREAAGDHLETTLSMAVGAALGISSPASHEATSANEREGEPTPGSGRGSGRAQTQRGGHQQLVPGTHAPSTRGSSRTELQGTVGGASSSSPAATNVNDSTGDDGLAEADSESDAVAYSRGLEQVVAALMAGDGADDSLAAFVFT